MIAASLTRIMIMKIIVHVQRASQLLRDTFDALMSDTFNRDTTQGTR
jgi:hypothetical protein